MLEIDYIFVDGGYLRALAREANPLGAKKVLEDSSLYSQFICMFIRDFIQRWLNDWKIFYYDAVVPQRDDPEEHKRRMSFFEDIQVRISDCEVKLGDLVITKDGSRQKGVDTLIAIDMITKAFLRHYDQAFLVAGDRDFANVVRAVREHTGRRVVGVYEERSCSPDLRLVFDRHMIFKRSDLERTIEASSRQTS